MFWVIIPQGDIHIQGSAFCLRCLTDTHGVPEVSDVSGVSDVYQVSHMYPESLRHIAYQMCQTYPDTPEASGTSDTPDTICVATSDNN